MSRSRRQSRHPCGPRAPRLRGFSLLEVLVALSVFAIAMGLAYGGLDAVVRARAQLEAQAAALAQLQRAVGLLERDLRGAVARPVREGERRVEPALRLDADGLALTRAGYANRLAQARAELERVRWQRDGAALRRLRLPALDRSPGGLPEGEAMLEGVQRLDIEALGDDGRWSPRWPPSGAAVDRLPRALRVRVELADWGEIERWFELVDPPAPRG
jgi:general secretion pathway protein J